MPCDDSLLEVKRARETITVGNHYQHSHSDEFPQEHADFELLDRSHCSKIISSKNYVM